jgi:hypothetical protein
LLGDRAKKLRGQNRAAIETTGLLYNKSKGIYRMPFAAFLLKMKHVRYKKKA